jgi:hypothetical protein
MGALKPLAVVRSYPELQQAFRAYIERINVSRAAVDHSVGWADGFAGKALCAEPMKGIGPTLLGSFLQGVGLALIVVQDADSFARRKNLLSQRDKRQVRTIEVSPMKKRKPRQIAVASSASNRAVITVMDDQGGIWTIENDGGRLSGWRRLPDLPTPFEEAKRAA